MRPCRPSLSVLDSPFFSQNLPIDDPPLLPGMLPESILQETSHDESLGNASEPPCASLDKMLTQRSVGAAGPLASMESECACNSKQFTHQSLSSGGDSECSTRLRSRTVTSNITQYTCERLSTTGDFDTNNKTSVSDYPAWLEDVIETCDGTRLPESTLEQLRRDSNNGSCKCGTCKSKAAAMKLCCSVLEMESAAARMDNFVRQMVDSSRDRPNHADHKNRN